MPLQPFQKRIGKYLFLHFMRKFNLKRIDGYGNNSYIADYYGNESIRLMYHINLSTKERSYFLINPDY